MQKYEIRGQDAEAMLNRMVTRDVKKIGLNRVAYCLWCTDEGRMIDDGTIFKLADNRFMLTCGSPCTAWLEMSAFGFDDVSVADITDDLAAISLAALSLQGPTSCAALKKMGLEGIDTAKPFDILFFPFHGDTLMVSRTGFTGDLGYELWIPPGLALDMWDELYSAGEDYGIQPYGEAATNMARLERGSRQASSCPRWNSTRPCEPLTSNTTRRRSSSISAGSWTSRNHTSAGAEPCSMKNNVVPGTR
jgi:aminomethyltransferase